MKTLKVLLCTSALPGAALIRMLTWSGFSHAAIVAGDEVIEAAWPRVRVRPLSDVLASHSHFVFVELPCTDPDAAIAAARTQVGKPYDVAALFGMLLHRDWQDPARWFCSELVAWAFAAAGSPLFRSESVQRVTPEHLWMLAPSPSSEEAETQINRTVTAAIRP